MSRNGRVIVAMSGGVDSSVTACLLKDQGYDCVGVFMRVGAAAPEEQACETTPGEQPRRLKHGCCSVNDAIDARVIAGKLGIPFYALNFEADFNKIINYFVDEYAVARTPNPCVMCNIDLKFGKLFQYADLMDAEFVATGHYARILRDHAGPAYLARSTNHAKDQSYVLFGIRRENLQRCMFPLGDIADKSEVRRLAEQLDLRVADKPDSQEICFVPNNDYKQLVRERRGDTQQPGEIRDAEGNIVGEHKGIANFTIGQRRGLGIAAGKPLYVLKLDVVENTVTVGAKADLAARGLVADHINWLQDVGGTRGDTLQRSGGHASGGDGETDKFGGAEHAAAAGRAPEAGAANGSRRCEIKIRHQHTPAPGEFEVLEDGAAFRARFDDPQTAVTPGQAAVLYDAHERVIGGGWIRAAE